MTVYPSIEESIAARRARLAREAAELERDELREENGRLREELEKKVPQSRKRTF